MKLLYFWKPIFIACIISYGSITPNNNLNILPIFNFKNFDKILHFIFYLSLSITFLSSLGKESKFKVFDIKIITFVFVVSYGILMEIVQFYLTTTRSAEFFDIIANSSGCILGIFVFPFLQKLKIAKFL